MARNARYGNVKRGRAIELADSPYFNSGWERDIARFLNLLMEWGVVEGWEYEPEEFLFTGNGYKRGPWSYKPDFCLKFSSKANKKVLKTLKDIGFEHAERGLTVWWEVKGQETGKDRSKWRRFRIHVGAPLEIIKRDKLLLIQTGFRPLIKTWESNVR